MKEFKMLLDGELITVVPLDECQQLQADLTALRAEKARLMSCICEHHNGASPDQWGCPGCLFNWKLTLKGRLAQVEGALQEDQIEGIVRDLEAQSLHHLYEEVGYILAGRRRAAGTEG